MNDQELKNIKDTLEECFCQNVEYKIGCKISIDQFLPFCDNIIKNDKYTLQNKPKILRLEINTLKEYIVKYQNLYSYYKTIKDRGIWYNTDYQRLMRTDIYSKLTTCAKKLIRCDFTQHKCFDTAGELTQYLKKQNLILIKNEEKLIGGELGLISYVYNNNLKKFNKLFFKFFTIKEKESLIKENYTLKLLGGDVAINSNLVVNSIMIQFSEAVSNNCDTLANIINAYFDKKNEKHIQYTEVCEDQKFQNSLMDAFTRAFSFNIADFRGDNLVVDLNTNIVKIVDIQLMPQNNHFIYNIENLNLKTLIELNYFKANTVEKCDDITFTLSKNNEFKTAFELYFLGQSKYPDPITKKHTGINILTEPNNSPCYSFFLKLSEKKGIQEMFWNSLNKTLKYIIDTRNNLPIDKWKEKDFENIKDSTTQALTRIFKINNIINTINNKINNIGYENVRKTLTGMTGITNLNNQKQVQEASRMTFSRVYLE